MKKTTKLKKIDYEQKKKIKDYIKSLTEKDKFKFWIKTFLTTHSIIPNIIKQLDKIIELQATTISFSSDIFNLHSSITKQFDQVIDLSERKNTLLNIYIMTKQMHKSLSEEEWDFLEKKYVYNWTAEDLATDYEISKRSVFRKVEQLIDKIYKNAIENKWSVRFIESQVKDEEWLREKYIKIIIDYFKSINYKMDYQSQSSSEL
ncbi:MAG: hypothetical protein IJ538_02220 [Clostridia bacterium]|nr:hypothetical protein [Clostridia bacterium]